MDEFHRHRSWRVTRRGSGLVLARFDSKPKAVAAALRFCADGNAYDVIEELSRRPQEVASPQAASNVVMIPGRPSNP